MHINEYIMHMQNFKYVYAFSFILAFHIIFLYHSILYSRYFHIFCIKQILMIIIFTYYSKTLTIHARMHLCVYSYYLT